MAERSTPDPSIPDRSRPERSTPERSLTRREALRITAVAGLATGFGGALTAGILRDARLHRVRRTRTRMGTLVTLTVVHPDPDGAAEMIDAGFREMARLETILSRHEPGAALARLNAQGRLTDPPAELRAVLAAALELATASSGAFDPTVLPLLEALRRAFARDGRPPSSAELAPALRLVDHRGVRFEPAEISLADPRMAVTLDGIAKGFVVDRTVDVLVDRGAERILVDAGGDVATAGEGASRDPWTVAVADPHRVGGRAAVLRLGGQSVATSGDYLNSYTADRRHHDIVDPRTGRSPEALSSVSVVAPSAMDADGLSTAVMVLGPERGLDLLERTPESEGLVVTKTGARLRTGGLRTRFG